MKRSPMPPRTARLAPGAPPARRTRMKARNADRKAREFARCYHSVERVEWVKSLECAVPSCWRVNIENAHTVTGGAGRKADAHTIVPLCGPHHRELHQVGTHTFQSVHGVDLAAVAARVAQAWEGTR